MTPPPSSLTLLVLGFDGFSLPEEMGELLSRGLGGVALFARNLQDREQVRHLNREIRWAARNWPPPIIAVDQEGGRVQRLRRLSPGQPPARELGHQGADAARVAGGEIGEDLHDLGFNTNFAPVLDLDTHPANPIIGDRAFGQTPEEAIPPALAFLEGLRTRGIQPCGKHFPGHGDAAADSHLDLPVIEAPEEMLARREMIPFQAAFRAGLDLVMTAHCLYPAVDPNLPATLSRAFLTDWLRGRLDYRGCVISDDLHMKAIADRFDPEFVVRQGILAGLDLLLDCGAATGGSDLVRALTAAPWQQRAFTERASQAIERVLALRRRLADPLPA